MLTAAPHCADGAFKSNQRRKAKLLSVISKAPSETQYNLISIPIMRLFSSIIKTTESLLQRNIEIVQAASWSV